MQTALITGASSGIGAAFARELAAQKYDLVLVARSETKLRQLEAELEMACGIEVEVIVKDLTQPNAAVEVYETVKQLGWSLDLLINNAGFGDYGEFGQRCFTQQSEMVTLNVLVVVELTHLFLPQMQQRRSGGVINVGSITGFQPIPYLAVYSASKAFVLRFSEALWAENKSKGVKIMALCPGPTQTNFFAAADMERNAKLMAAQTYEDPRQVARQALKAMQAGRSHLVTGGWQNHMLVNASRLTPRELLAEKLEAYFRPPET